MHSFCSDETSESLIYPGPAPEICELFLYQLPIKKWHTDEAKTIKNTFYADISSDKRRKLVFIAPWAENLPTEMPFRLTREMDFLLVCIDGEKNTCCATKWVLLAQKLSQKLESKILYCSHVGWCRYAPNVLFSRTGDMYGQIKENNIDDFANALLNNSCYFPCLRGNIDWIESEELMRYGQSYLFYRYGLNFECVKETELTDRYEIVYKSTEFEEEKSVVYTKEAFTNRSSCNSDEVTTKNRWILQEH